MRVVMIVLLVLLAGVAASVAVRFLWRSSEVRFDRQAVRMEVINGCGIQRVGRAVADDLLLRGYNVYSVGNCIEHYARTRVVDLRDPRCANAGQVARSLAVRRRWWRIPLWRWFVPDTLAAIDSTRFLEVRLVVGDDYRTYFPAAIPLH
jgi:hypothetical protein